MADMNRKKELLTNPKEDFFDKLVDVICKPSWLKWAEQIYLGYKSILLYLFFGGIAFCMYFVLYALFTRICNMQEIVATILCNIICITFQFFTNRTYCFDSKVDSVGAFMKQMGEFFLGRAFTFAADILITFVFITTLHWPDIPVKIFDQVFIIVSNYIISKFWVFKKKEDK